MKKLKTFVCSLLLLCSSVFAVELQIRLLPDFSIPVGTTFDFLYGGTASIDILPLTIRGQDDLYFSLQGGASSLNGKGISPEPIFDVGIAAGYNFRIIDRLSLALEGYVYGYTAPAYENTIKAQNSSGKDESGEKKDVIEGLSGISVGGRFLTNFYVSPAFEVSAFAGFRHYIYDPAFIDKIEFGLGLTYNFTKGLFGTSNVDINEYSTQPLFPVFYSRYDDHSFGFIKLQNSEKNNITDVSVSVFIEQYMSNPKIVANFPVVKRGEEFSVDLTAFLNETILNLLQNQLVDAKVEVSYRSLGKQMSKSITIGLQTLTRNSMSWEDDRRAAAFVSGHDSSAQLFARQIESIIRKQLNPNIPINIQYAAAVFGALKAYGINYVIDPSSAFTDNIGTASVDFLQFPYQTLLYHGGDCDDLSILNCSLLQALGVETAFITVPGHIYMAFDAGVSVDQADKVNGGKNIVMFDKVWVPVEITVSQDTFGLALQTGYREWKKYEKEAALIPISHAWNEYSPVSVPESDIGIETPERSTIINEFNNAMKFVK